jgi:hypothetical protein
MEPEFEKFISEARDQFVRKVNEQEWDTQLRMEAENLLVAYDQMRERLREQSRQAAVSGSLPDELLLAAIKYGYDYHSTTSFSK